MLRSWIGVPLSTYTAPGTASDSMPELVAAAKNTTGLSGQKLSSAVVANTVPLRATRTCDVFHVWVEPSISAASPVVPAKPVERTRIGFVVSTGSSSSHTQLSQEVPVP